MGHHQARGQLPELDVREYEQQDCHESESSPNLNKLGHIKRPMNEFFLWSQEERKRLQEENPTVHNTKISKMLGVLWKQVPNETKKEYVAKANQLRESHKEQCPDYKYSQKKKYKNLKRVKMSKSSVEAEEESDNLTAAIRLYQLYQLQNDLQQKQQQFEQQQRQQQFEAIQRFFAGLHAMPLLLQNLPFLQPPSPQVAAGNTSKGKMECEQLQMLHKQLQQQVATTLQPFVPTFNAVPLHSQNLMMGGTSNDIFGSGKGGLQMTGTSNDSGNGSQELFGAMNRNLNASSAAEAFPSMDPSMAQLFLLHLMNYNPYYLLGLSSMTQTGANVPSFSDAVNDPSLHPGTSGFKK